MAQAERNARVAADRRLERIWALGRLAVDHARAERIRAAMGTHPERVTHGDRQRCTVCHRNVTRLDPNTLKGLVHRAFRDHR